MKNRRGNFFIVLLLIFMLVGSISLIVYGNALGIIVMGCGMSLVSLYFLMSFVFKESKNKVIIIILEVLDKLAGVVISATMYIKSYIIGISMMAFMLMIITGIIYICSKYVFKGIISYKGSIYLSAVLTLVMSSYKGSKILDIFIKFTCNTKGIISGYSNYKGIEYFSNLNLRKLCYQISIGLYMLTKTINLGEISILSNESIQLISSLIAEVFLTFVAIDCYICTFKNDIINKNLLEYEEIKAKYLEKYNEEYKKYNKCI